jgi:hypothetical protein
MQFSTVLQERIIGTNSKERSMTRAKKKWSAKASGQWTLEKRMEWAQLFIEGVRQEFMTDGSQDRAVRLAQSLNFILKADEKMLRDLRVRLRHERRELEEEAQFRKLGARISARRNPGVPTATPDPQSAAA